MRKVYAKEEVCIGCRLCEVHCVVEHSRSRDMVRAYKGESPRPLPRVRVEEQGPVSFALQCRHCAEPLCVYSCLTGAMQKDPTTGVVTVDAERCVGCWTCVMVCAYGAITMNYDGHPSAVKCDLCPRLEVPACVAACPNEALIYREDGS